MTPRPLGARSGRTAVRTIMQGKEAAIGPVLARFTGLRAVVLDGSESDRFGTFPRRSPRRQRNRHGHEAEQPTKRAQADPAHCDHSNP
jgi:hypothetical protein